MKEKTIDDNRLQFNSTTELCDAITSFADNIDEFEFIGVYGNFEIIKDIFQQLVRLGYDISDEDEINLESPDISNYTKEFVLYLGNEGLSIEKVYRDGKYLNLDDTVSLVWGGCNSKMLQSIYSDKIYEFDVDDEDCENVDCGFLDVYVNSPTVFEGEQHGFSVFSTTDKGNYQFSFYSSDKDLVREVAEQFK